ncbi:MAG: aminotransferase class V-fold PLP-dependent enzyme [Anaerolineae bacterium]
MGVARTGGGTSQEVGVPRVASPLMIGGKCTVQNGSRAMHSDSVASSTDDVISQVRAEIPALRWCTYLNTGGVAPTPRAVTDAVVNAYKWISELGYHVPEVYCEIPRRMASVRQRVAHLMGAHPDEIALLHNTTEGLNVVAHGLTWEPGDEVVLGDQENPAALIPFANLALRRGVVIRRLPVSDAASRILADLEALINPRTKLVVLSHVTHVTGLVLPFNDICRLARCAAVPVLWDGAQALGQIPVSLQAGECDFYSGCSYKWLLGPFGGGILYIHRDWLDRLGAWFVGKGSEALLDLETLNLRLKNSAARYEYGARAWPVHVGLAEGISLIEQIGLERIRLRVLQLAAHARQRLRATRNVVLMSPEKPQHVSGLVTVAVPGLDAESIVRALWEKYRVLIQWRFLPPGSPADKGLRFSLGFFTTLEEIDYAINSLEREILRLSQCV